ncbi:MAG: hypothetical protein ACM31G_09900 [Flavobacteriales bacterium]
MKKLACIIFALILFNACQNQPQRYFSESPEIESSKKLVNYFASHNYEGIKEIYSDSVKIYDNSVEPITLSDMITSMKANEDMMEYMKVKDSADYEMVLTKDDETWVNCWYTVVGKFKGLTSEVIVPCHSTFQFKDGKVVKEYSYYNLLPVYQEMEKLNDTTAVDTMATQ